MTTEMNQGRRRRRTRPYPQRTLEYCLEVVETVFRHGGGGSLDRVVLAGKLGTTPSSSAFVIRLGSCERYGLTTSNGGIVELTDRGEAAAAPSSPDERKAALVEAALEPELFRRFYNAYDGQKLPYDEMAMNMLRRDLGVEEELTAECLDVLKQNGLYAGLLGDVGGSLYVSANGAHASQQSEPSPGSPGPGADVEVLHQAPPPPADRDILIGHSGASDVARTIESTLALFEVPFRTLELDGGATFDGSAADVTSTCGAAIIVHAGPSSPPLDDSIERRAREDAVNLIGGATALYGNRVLILRERGLERLRQESSVDAMQFRRGASDELGLELLRRLHEMEIIQVLA